MREYEAMIQSVSPKQIAEFTRRLLSSKPSLAAFGDGTDVLNYDNLVQRYADANWSQRSSNPMGAGASPYADGQMSHSVFEMLKKGLSMGGGRSISSSSSSSSGSRTVSSGTGSSSLSSSESSNGSS
jgi:hypothetical protein